MRLKPRVEDGETARCKHIQRARSFFLDELLRAISKAAGEGKDR
jgi:hypothetical protein